MRRLALLLLLVGAVGCNEPLAALWLRVEAPLSIPGEVDALDIEVHRVADGAVLYAASKTLETGMAFPQTLSLTTHELKTLDSAGVDIRVTAQRQGALAKPWSQGTTHAVLVPGEDVVVTVRLCDCVP